MLYFSVSFYLITITYYLEILLLFTPYYNKFMAFSDNYAGTY